MGPVSSCMALVPTNGGVCLAPPARLLALISHLTHPDVADRAHAHTHTRSRALPHLPAPALTSRPPIPRGRRDGSPSLLTPKALPHSARRWAETRPAPGVTRRGQCSARSALSALSARSGSWPAGSPMGHGHGCWGFRSLYYHGLVQPPPLSLLRRACRRPGSRSLE